MKIFYLPDLGEGLAEAEIREWYIKEGDIVTVDQPLLSVETAKAVVDVPSPYAGCITRLHGKARDIIKTHAPLIEFDGNEKTQDHGSIVGKLEESQKPLEEEVIVGVSTSLNRLKASAIVKALAKQLQVDLNQVTPTGARDEITVADVKRHAGKHSSVKPLENGEVLHGVRRVMAIAMSEAHREIAQVTIMDDADIGNLPSETDLTAMLLKAIASGVEAEPALNAWFNGQALERQLLEEINIGIAMDTPEGLFVPVIKNVAQSSMLELRQQIDKLKRDVKARTIAQQDMQGATLILSNFGTIAGKYASPMVVPPMVAILGCGRIHEAPVVKGGKVIATRILPLSLSVDHRAVTGGEAARFLAAIKEFLQRS